MTVVHFYHCLAGGAWREPVAEHLAALEDSGFDGPFTVGLVGPRRERAKVLAELHAIRPPDLYFPATEGWEQVTLREVHKHAQKHDDAILYAHTKGAAFPAEFQDAWRRSMTYHVVNAWRENLQALEDDVDAVGCHWLTPSMQDPRAGFVSGPMFGGNFWMARGEYLRSLPAPAMGSRHDAEVWIGLGNPRVLDLLPGWPGAQPFPRTRIRRLLTNVT